MRAYAKVNIFLKITGKRGDYHEILSRFMLVKNLFDELSFVPRVEKDRPFEIIGAFSCVMEQNTIYKAFTALCEVLDETREEELRRFMKNHAVLVEKNIPAFAGLGGGSSDAASFLIMCNNTLSLGLDVKELAAVGIKVGADVAFFLYGYDSATVSGIGEVVEKFDEPLLELEVFTPAVEISTQAVYRCYRDNFYAPVDAQYAQKLRNSSSAQLLGSMKIAEANDLFAPALACYPQLSGFLKDGYFFSGSGSSFFKMV